MTLRELKQAMLQLSDDAAEIQIGVYVDGNDRLITTSGELVLTYQAHPDKPGIGLCILSAAKPILK